MMLSGQVGNYLERVLPDLVTLRTRIGRLLNADVDPLVLVELLVWR